jgi:hypothetical protein
MDKKISQLTAAAPLTGTEVLPVVQSGQTVSTTVQDIADLAAGVPYKSYVAIVSQSGTNNPIVTVMENTIGTMTVTRNGVGDYYFSSPSFNSFSDFGKIAVLITNGNGAIAKTIQAYYLPPASVVQVLTSDISTVAFVDSVLQNATIEIRQYP